MPNDPFYSTGQWRRARAFVLQRDNHICQLQHAGCTLKATEVDHIIERKHLPKNSTLHLDPHNLRSLCGSCHRVKTHGKRDLAHTGPSGAW